jgi:hypothetical protein
MRLRRCTVEPPFATIKFRIFGRPRLLMRGLSGAKVEIVLATMAYKLKRITHTRRNQTNGSSSSGLIGARRLNGAILHLENV